MSDKPLGSSALLRDAVRAIESSHRRIAVIVDDAGSLLGTLTDGDIRRCLLTGGTLETLACEAMNAKPVVAQEGSTDQQIMHLMKSANILAVPIVRGDRCFVNIVHLSDLRDAPSSEYDSGFDTAVIMAGGEGNRLRPLTNDIPKPMIDIGGIPLLERQVCRLAEANVKRCYISVNYLSHVIEEHFGSGEVLDVEIQYLRENIKLGTAGALSLLPKNELENPIVVMNGDVLTKCNFSGLREYHIQHKAAITVAVIDHIIDIPFGVISPDGVYATRLEEKPSQRFLCNAGIYAISPTAFELIPNGMFFNMTDLINACFENDLAVGIFPLHEYWSDIGTLDDLEKARSIYALNQEVV